MICIQSVRGPNSFKVKKCHVFTVNATSGHFDSMSVAERHPKRNSDPRKQFASFSPPKLEVGNCKLQVLGVEHGGELKKLPTSRAIGTVRGILQAGLFVFVTFFNHGEKSQLAQLCFAHVRRKQ